METFAIQPSPAPTIISPFGSKPKQLTPNENNFLIGASLL
jgi:hypothetical protein